MNKEFVPYELALELKQLGFDEPCFGFYRSVLGKPEVEMIIRQTPPRFYHLATIPEHFDILAPTYSQAFRWFREKHNLIGGVQYIGGLKPETTWWDIYVVGHFNTNICEMSIEYQPYEEAELACLKKLIEIANEQQ